MKFTQAEIDTVKAALDIDSIDPEFAGRVCVAMLRVGAEESLARVHARQITATHTVAELPVSESVFEEISELLHDAGYDHVFHDNIIDMTGIGLSVR